MEHCLICPQKDRRGKVLEFSPFSKCIVWWRRYNAVAQRNQLGYDQDKVPLDKRLLWMAFHNRRRRENSTLPPIAKMLDRKKSREICMDVRYWISEGIVSPTTVPPDSKPLRSESEILATKARGSCGVDPGPVRVTFSPLPMGEWLYGVRKRLVKDRSLMFSTFAMPSFTALAVSRWGGGTDLALIRPRNGSPGAGVLEGIAPSSAKIR